MKELCMILLVVISAGLYSSCADKEFVDNRSPKEYATNDFVVYPLAKQASTRASSAFDTDWENQIFVQLNSGKKVNLPWYNGDANLPMQMRYDVKKEDGWTLILHTFSTPAVVTEKTNYMFLYNQRTSILKVLYYVESPWANNAGFWKIHLGNQRHQFFNHTGELALPMNINYVNNWITTNASCMEDLSFREGWNGFQIQLAYDTTNDATGSILNLVTANSNITKKSMYGEFDGYSQGTLVTHGSTNPVSTLVNDIASVFGDEAKSYITDKFGKDDETTTRSAIVAGIGGAVVKWGANKVLGAITAGFSKPTVRVSDLSFTTRTKGTLSGQDTFDANAPSLTFAPNFSTTDLGCHLGAWNLAETPTVYVDPRADVIPKTNESGYNRNYRLRGISGYKYDLVINPDLGKHIIKKWVKIDPVRYQLKPDSVLKNPIKNFDYGNLGTTETVTFSDSRFNEQTCFYSEGNMKIYNDDMRSVMYMRDRLYYKYNKVLSTIFVPLEEEFSAELPKYNMSNRYLKFSLYLVTDFEGKRDTTLHTRTFAPKVEWDPVLYEAYKDEHYERLP